MFSLVGRCRPLSLGSSISFAVTHTALLLLSQVGKWHISYRKWKKQGNIFLQKDNEEWGELAVHSLLSRGITFCS